jgi:hypothetical protein
LSGNDIHAFRQRGVSVDGANNGASSRRIAGGYSDRAAAAVM